VSEKIFCLPDFFDYSLFLPGGNFSGKLENINDQFLKGYAKTKGY
jgi:hypothetical protein